MSSVPQSTSTRVGGLQGEEGTVDAEEVISSGIIPTSLQAQVERNRQRALLLRQSRLMTHPYARIDPQAVEQSIIRVHGSRFIDTRGGFLLQEGQRESATNPNELVETLPPIIGPDRPNCLECRQRIPDSFLLQHFDHPVCDGCRDNAEKHALITKTEAKKEYLLKDCDFDRRQPALKYILKRNPHNPSWGEMKLYLQLQVEQRALEVWGSKEALEEEKNKMQQKRDVAKYKRFQKDMKKLRMNVRSGMFDKTTGPRHVHDFGPETCIEEDTYTHACQTCGFKETYEKM